VQTYFSQHNPTWLTSYGLGTNKNGNYNRTGRGLMFFYIFSLIDC
jgi:hypothetical protein